MINKLSHRLLSLSQNKLFRNSSWGVISQISQTIFLSLFFVILARKYNTGIFAKYIIANAIYQLVTAVSTMGLSQWFVREFFESKDQDELTGKFLNMQIIFGVLFYILNIILAYLIYPDQFIRLLIIVLGFNIIFDNIINGIKSLNVAQFEQKKTFIILTIETFLKFIAACALFIYPFSVIALSVLLILIRFLTLNLFLNFGSTKMVNLKTLRKFKVSYADIKDLVIRNWAFVIIGGVSIINWRIGNIIVSKTLSAFDVANYEISFKIFSIAQILPVVISTSVFPMLVKLYTNSDKKIFLDFYKKMHLYYMLFGLFSFTFIYSFSASIIPVIFGENYLSNPLYTCQMFLTILIFPTALLQANVLITMKLEKQDMLFNIILLLINFCLSLIGLHYIRSLSMVNYSIFISFLIFHILQDIVLVKRQITSLRSVAVFYLFSATFVYIYIALAKTTISYILFIVTWGMIAIFLFFFGKAKIALNSGTATVGESNG